MSFKRSAVSRILARPPPSRGIELVSPQGDSDLLRGGKGDIENISTCLGFCTSFMSDGFVSSLVSQESIPSLSNPISSFCEDSEGLSLFSELLVCKEVSFFGKFSPFFIAELDGEGSLGGFVVEVNGLLESTFDGTAAFPLVKRLMISSCSWNVFLPLPPDLELCDGEEVLAADVDELAALATGDEEGEVLCVFVTEEGLFLLMIVRGELVRGEDVPLPLPLVMLALSLRTPMVPVEAGLGATLGPARDGLEEGDRSKFSVNFRIVGEHLAVAPDVRLGLDTFPVPVWADAVLTLL